MSSNFRRFTSSLLAIVLSTLLAVPSSLAESPSENAPKRGSSTGKGGQTPAHAADDKDETASDDERYIVKFRQFGPASRALIRDAGGEVIMDIHGYDAVAARLPEQAFRGLQHHPEIEYIERDERRYPMSTSWSDVVTPSGEVIPYGLFMVQADQLSDAAVANRKVCIIDSGYYRGHDDLQRTDVTASPDPGTGDPFVDNDGHGTHVAGTIAAVGGNGTGVRGVIQSQQLRLHIVKVFGDNGAWAYSSSLVNAVTECRNAGANIISMSLGGPSNVSAENTAFTNAYNAGVLSIAAAGNAGTTALSYPASYSTVMSVAAVDSNENHADFSQRNSQVEIAAPGVAVLSTVSYKETNSLTIGSTTYDGNYIDLAARSTGVTGPLASGGRCTATNGAWSGAVVLCERGDVSFWDKVRNVQNSGGRAAVIYNNVPGGFFGTMDPNSSTIPAISLTQEDGQAILASGVIGSSATVVSRVEKPATFGYDWFNGTSMATPHVSGVAALVWSYNPSWTNAQIRTALQQTARDKGAAGRDNLFGFGIVQAKGALDYLCATTGQGCSTPASAITATSGCTTDTTQGDFYTGGENISLTESPGDVVLLKSGATESLDAQQDTMGNFGNTVTATTWQGQTFRPLTSGQLSRLDVSFFCNSCSGTQPMTVEIRTTSSGLPTNTVLATTTIPAFAGGTAYRTAIFNNPATVTAGVQYAYVLRLTTNNAAGSYAHNRTQSDAYAGGTILTSTNSGTSWSTAGQDFRFRVFISVGVAKYAHTGTLLSSIKDSMPPGFNDVSWGVLTWNATTPAGTSVEFQVAAGNSAADLANFVGPDGTSGSFFVTNGASLALFDGNRFLRIKSILRTNNDAITPKLHDLSVCYATDLPLTAITVAPSSGSYGGTTTVSATLRSNGAPLSGKSLTFTMNGTSLGSATTNASGIAAINPVSLAGIDAGTYSSGISASFSEAGFVGSSSSGELHVAKADATVSVNGYTGVYDGNAHGATGSATGVMGEDLSSLFDFGASFTDAPGGTAHWSFNGSNANTNYNGVSGSVAVTIAKATASISVDGSTVIYDGQPHGASGSATGVKGEDLSNLLTLGNSFTSVPGGAANWSFAGNGNYEAANGSVAVTITPRPLTITADDQTMVRNTAVPALTGSIEGDISSDSISATYSTTANGRSLGSFPIVPAAVDPEGRLSNYAVTLQNGSLFVVEAAIQACTPGFWQGGVGSAWWNVSKDADWKGQLAQPYFHGTDFNKFFTSHSALNGRSMFDVLSVGATSVAAQKAARGLVAGYLNTSHKSGYGLTQQQLRDKWTAAVRSGDAALHALADELDELNNLFDCRR